MKPDSNTGIYCLANDRVYDWMIAFLESVRTHEPDSRLIVVPFDQNIRKLAKMANKYRFEFFTDVTVLRSLDEVGAMLRPQRDIHIHRFRTLACFFGPLEHFIFLDSDIVLLNNLKELFEVYFHQGCQFMYNRGRLFKWVYLSGEFRDRMIEEYSANGFNAGAFISSRGVFSLEQIHRLAIEANQIKHHFFPKGIVQPFINYCVDISRLSTESFSKIIPDLGVPWAKFGPITKVDESYQIKGKRLIYVHWAGFKPGSAMPNRKLFLSFRLKNRSVIYRSYYLLKDWFKARVFSLKKSILLFVNQVNNKWLNRIYNIYKRLKKA